MGYVLDTSDIPAPDRVEAVHTAMMHASAPCHVLHENPDGGIHARMEVWDLGNANIFTHRSSGIRLLRTAKLARQDGMPVIALSVQQRADGRIEQRARQRVVPPGELLVVDLSGAYDFSWSGDGAAGCLQIPYDQLGLPLDLVRRAAFEVAASPLYPMVTAHIAQLSRRAAGIATDAASATVAAASIDLARALLVSAARSGRHRQVRAETLLTRVRAFVRMRLADPDLTPAAIATAHGISLRQLYKVCAEANLSIEQWIISERLHRVRHELTQPDRQHVPIGVIALRWGFRDPTHFTRRFKARYGMTPSQWRRASAAARA
ncbi:helix-turn-helix domain-containing protein [Micromonospora sp. WMMD882]|uniref:helix-turn-helix domain-containing protein n=1 Tax=Micromonospora sp. WMMD882 TaxID=3015151 RepID=UPI00248B20A1|nr:helix-turn-helix domain-containing protein [Micromonospora sp. WMMD882]WBB80404.1 helix-turn-helix domain-containing protein [Micromonospora sp. WMMD882]